LDFTFLGIRNFSGPVGTLHEGFGNLRARSGSNPELGPPGALGRSLGRGLATRWGAAWTRLGRGLDTPGARPGRAWAASWPRLGRVRDAPGPRPGRAWAASWDAPGPRPGRVWAAISRIFLGSFWASLKASNMIFKASFLIQNLNP